MSAIDILLKHLKDSEKYFGNPKYHDWRTAIEYEIEQHYLRL